jgi:hypothetical protein
MPAFATERLRTSAESRSHDKILRQTGRYPNSNHGTRGQYHPPPHPQRVQIGKPAHILKILGDATDRYCETENTIDILLHRTMIYIKTIRHPSNFLRS